MADRRKILLVEDESIVALAERASLERCGYAVQMVRSGEEAVAAFGIGTDPDLVLMDIDLGPGIDGTQAAERILAVREVPIVFLSSHTEPEVVERTERITSYGYVVKNSSTTVLDASIKMAFKLFEADRRTREHERKQEALIANISDVIAVLDPDGTSRYMSPNVRTLFGWEAAELVGGDMRGLIHPEDLAAEEEWSDRILEEEERSDTSEFRIRCKDGSYRWVEATLANLVGDPIVNGLLVNFRDISERRRAEEENRFERLFATRLLESLPGIFYMYEYPELRLVRWNRSYEDLLGFAPVEMEGRPLLSWHPPESSDEIRAAVEAAMEKGQNQIEAPMIAKDGRLIPFLLTGMPFEAVGRRYFMGIGLDLTENRRMESELRESQARLAALFGAMTEMVVLHELIFDGEGKPVNYRILGCNKAFTEVTGIRREDAVGRLATEVYDQPAAPYLDVYAPVALSGQARHYTTYFEPMRKHFSISVVSPGRNQFATITSDITELREFEGRLQRKVEEYEVLNEELSVSLDEVRRANGALEERTRELAAQKELFSRFMDNLPAIAFLKDSAGTTLFTNAIMDKVLGSAGWVGLRSEEIFDPAVARRLREDDERSIREGYRLIEESFPDVDGRIRDYETRKFAIPMPDGETLLGGIAIDVTAQKRTEAELRQKTEELDRYFTSSLDLLCIADTDGYFLRLNPEWESVLGYRIQDLEGRRFLDFVHPDDLQDTLDAIATLSGQGQILNFENRYRHKDGSYRWIEWRSHPQGRLIYAAARDVTERRRVEDELKRQVEEKGILLKEVQHRIKNNLASIESLVSLQAGTAEHPEARSALNDALGRIAGMRLLYEKLLAGEQYTESSAKEYLESLVDSVSDALTVPPGISVSSRLEDVPLSPKTLFPLGIIANELLTNALKYAFRGRDRGSVEIVLEKNGPSARLEVRDDGCGLPEGFRIEESRGFGLTLVRMLAEQIHGDFSITSEGGARAAVRFDIAL